MRKQLIVATELIPPEMPDEWLNLEENARVEVSSEDPQHPINWHSRMAKVLVGMLAGQVSS